MSIPRYCPGPDGGTLDHAELASWSTCPNCGRTMMGDAIDVIDTRYRISGPDDVRPIDNDQADGVPSDAWAGSSPTASPDESSRSASWSSPPAATDCGSDGPAPAASASTAGDLTAELDAIVEGLRLAAALGGRPDNAMLEAAAAMLERFRWLTVPAEEGQWYLERYTHDEGLTVVSPGVSWVAKVVDSFHRLLDGHDAPNYLAFDLSPAGSAVKYPVLICRPGRPSPHELRMAAEAERDRLANIAGGLMAELEDYTEPGRDWSMSEAVAEYDAWCAERKARGDG